MTNYLKDVARKVKQTSGLDELLALSRKQHLLLAEMRADMLRQDPRYADPRRLNRHENQVLSQFGEDGIISEIFRRIGETNRQFVEFGVGDGMENNTAALLLKGWKGAWMEGSPESAATIRKTFSKPISGGQLVLKETFVTRDNIETLFKDLGVPAEPDLLSIDIDGNDYWIWKEIRNYRPRVVVVEYNATFGADIEWVMKHNPDHRFASDNYFGSSLKAYEKLFTEKGYKLVGCGMAGINAFFVREDLVSEDRFLAPFTSENHYEPPRTYLHVKLGEPRTPKIFSN